MENQKKQKKVGIGRYMYRMVARKIGRLLYEERIARGLRVEQVATLLGVYGKYVKNAEYGGEDMNWMTAGMLLRLYHKQLVFSLEDWSDEMRELMFTRAEYVRHKTEI